MPPLPITMISAAKFVHGPKKVHGVTNEGIAERTGKSNITSRTVINAFDGEIRPRPDTMDGLTHVVIEMSRNGLCPPIDRCDLYHAKWHWLWRNRYEMLSSELHTENRGVEKEVHDFLLQTWVYPTPDEPLRDRNWIRAYVAANARFWNADIRYDAIVALPEHFSSKRDDLDLSAECYGESFEGFRRLRLLLQKLPDRKNHDEYFDIIDTLVQSEMSVAAMNLVGFAIEAKEKGWNSDNIPTLEGAGNALREAIPKPIEWEKLARYLTEFFPGAAWTARTRWNLCCGIVAMISLGEMRDPSRVLDTLKTVRATLSKDELAVLRELPTTRRALQFGLPRDLL